MRHHLFLVFYFLLCTNLHAFGSDSNEVFNWSNPETWIDLQIPVAGDEVVIPEGKTIVMDVIPPPLKFLIINGHLKIGQQPGLALHVEQIEVNDGGVFEIGRRSDPFMHTFSISFLGSREDQEGLIINEGGSWMIHSQTAASLTQVEVNNNLFTSTDELPLMEEIHWMKGTTFVLAAKNQASLLTVEGISNYTLQTRQIFGMPFKKIEATVPLIGRLSHPVKVRTEGSATVMIHSGAKRIQLAGVTFEGSNQEQSARHFFNWDGEQEEDNQWIKNCSFSHFTNGAIRIAEPENVLIKGNVFYNINGPALEISSSGKEVENRIENNLIVDCEPSNWNNKAELQPY
jgi:hypothetical protein